MRQPSEKGITLYQSIVDLLPHGVICQDQNGNILTINAQAEHLLGLTREQLSPHTIHWGNLLCDNQQQPYNTHNHPALLALKKNRPVHHESCVIKSQRWLSIDSIPINTDGSPAVLSTLTDITELKQREEQAQSSLFKLSAIERINHISLDAETVEEMLEQALEELLATFNCDRAALLYPCNPDADSFSIPYEQTRPEWPGAKAQSRSVPMGSHTSELLLISLNSPQPLCFGGQNELPVPSEIKHHFHILSQMVMTLHPKFGDPWALIIHHCTEEHLFNDEERWLFNEIGSRITNTLSNLIDLRNLRENEERYRSLVENAPDALFVLDATSHQLVDVNKNSCTLFGMRRSELLEIETYRLNPINQPNGLNSAKQFQHFIDQTLAGQQPVFEWVFINTDNRRLECEVRLIQIPNNKELLVRGSIIDISERKRKEAHMRQLSRALQQTADAITITDKYGVIEYVNPSFEAITGYSSAEVVGQTPQILSSQKHPPEFYQKLWRTISAGETFSDTITNKKKDGTLFHEEKTITPLKDDNGNITHFIATGRDITERINTQERLLHLAHHDLLTDLPNRGSFNERLQMEVKHAHRKERRVAVLFIDLDRFKIINDTLGHDVGDQVLQTAAVRLVNGLRASDTVARLGGDEFAILLPEIASTDEVTMITEKLLLELAKPLYINERELFISASIGISLYPDDSVDPRILVKHADMAMYRAKSMGRNTYRFFSAELSNRADERLTLESNLRRALEREEFCLHYQPQISFNTGRITGVEALLRWQQPGQGLTPPDQFIPILEETGLIIEVGEWVARNACQQLRHWHDAGYPIRMAINVSSRQFNDKRLEERVQKAIQQSGVPATAIELEITESLLMQNPSRTEQTLKNFAQMGINLAIDDFGVGYSSLSYLRRFPLNTLKIDRAFVNDITTDPDDAAIITTIIAMAKALKLATVAEGVETQAQLDFLRALHCDTVQGYLFSKPVLPAEIDTLLTQYNGITEPQKEKGRAGVSPARPATNNLPGIIGLSDQA